MQSKVKKIVSHYQVGSNLLKEHPVTTRLHFRKMKPSKDVSDGNIREIYEDPELFKGVTEATVSQNAEGKEITVITREDGEAVDDKEVENHPGEIKISSISKPSVGCKQEVADGAVRERDYLVSKLTKYSMAINEVKNEVESSTLDPKRKSHYMRMLDNITRVLESSIYTMLDVVDLVVIDKDYAKEAADREKIDSDFIHECQKLGYSIGRTTGLVEHFLPVKSNKS